MNVLHVAFDEKFVDFAADAFDSVPGVANRYLVIVDDVAMPLRHVARREGVRAIRSARCRPRSVAPDLAWCDALVVHYLGLQSARLIAGAPASVCVAWSGWGGDYHDMLPARDEELLGPSTRRLIARHVRRGRTWRALGDYAVLAARRLRRRFVTDALFRRAVARVDLFSAPIPDDFELIARAFGPTFRAEYAQLNYASVEKTFSRGPARITDNAILVGNSASATNNHADVFDLLASLPLGERKIVVPLSYGDPQYRDAVVAYGRERFGDRFVPVVEYLPLERYNALIAQCAVAVMGHRRQQALGNIGTMLHSGARVFLDPGNPIYGCLRGRGAAVFELEALRESPSSMLDSLMPKDVATNRAVLAAFWGHDVVLRNTSDFVVMLDARSRYASRATDAARQTHPTLGNVR